MKQIVANYLLYQTIYYVITMSSEGLWWMRGNDNDNPLYQVRYACPNCLPDDCDYNQHYSLPFMNLLHVRRFGKCLLILTTTLMCPVWFMGVLCPCSVQS